MNYVYNDLLCIEFGNKDALSQEIFQGMIFQM